MTTRNGSISLVFGAAVLIAVGCAPDAAPESVAFTFPPSDTATLLAPGVISTVAPEFATSFSTDGNIVYFNRASADRARFAIMESRFENGEWTAAVTAAFSGTWRDVDPFVAPDGRRLYFSSNRPVAAGNEAADFNTWFVERVEAGWSEPVLMGAPVNTEAQEVFVSVDATATLYFSSDRDGTQRVYRSRPVSGGYEVPEVVPFDLNLQEGAGNPLITREGNVLIVATDREGGFGGADLWATCMMDGQWSPAVNLGPRVNSAQADFAPAWAAAGRYLVFTSERPGVVTEVAAGERPPGDLYYVALSAIGLSCPG